MSELNSKDLSLTGLSVYLVQNYVTLKQMNISFNRIKYFTYHSKRCKKQEDVIKLIMLIAAETCLLYNLINKNIEYGNELINEIFNHHKIEL